MWLKTRKTDGTVVCLECCELERQHQSDPNPRAQAGSCALVGSLQSVHCPLREAKLNFKIKLLSLLGSNHPALETNSISNQTHMATNIEKN